MLHAQEASQVFLQSDTVTYNTAINACDSWPTASLLLFEASARTLQLDAPWPERLFDMAGAPQPAVLFLAGHLNKARRRGPKIRDAPMNVVSGLFHLGVPISLLPGPDGPAFDRSLVGLTRERRRLENT